MLMVLMLMMMMCFMLCAQWPNAWKSVLLMFDIAVFWTIRKEWSCGIQALMLKKIRSDQEEDLPTFKRWGLILADHWEGHTQGNPTMNSWLIQTLGISCKLENILNFAPRQVQEWVGMSEAAVETPNSDTHSPNTTQHTSPLAPWSPTSTRVQII